MTPGEILTLQRCCWVSEAQVNEGVPIPALLESLDDVRRSLDEWTTVVVRTQGRLIGSVRGRLTPDGTWDIGRLMVAPDLEGRGLGRWLLAHVEHLAPPQTTSYRLTTGAGSARNHRLYHRAGYRRAPEEPPHHGVIVLSKRARRGGRFRVARVLWQTFPLAPLVPDPTGGPTESHLCHRGARHATSATHPDLSHQTNAWVTCGTDEGSERDDPSH